jgi:hypothetical protein
VFLAFIGAQRRALTEEADGLAQVFRMKGISDGVLGSFYLLVLGWGVGEGCEFPCRKISQSWGREKCWFAQEVEPDGEHHRKRGF